MSSYDCDLPLQHNHKGNCWDLELVFVCKRGCPNAACLCCVCHEHDMPRGECDECPDCPGCEEGRE